VRPGACPIRRNAVWDTMPWTLAAGLSCWAIHLVAEAIMRIFILVLGAVAAISGGVTMLSGLGIITPAPQSQALALTLVGTALLITGCIAMWLSRRRQ
jgi:hypothetical protein